MEKKKKPEYNNIVFDSNEEIDFYKWCEEALDKGLIESFCYQPNPFKLSSRASIKVTKQLKTKTKIVDKFLLHPHEYTADFALIPSHGLIFTCDDLISTLDDNCVVIDVKGSFMKYHDGKSFSINQKWVFSQYGIYVNKVVPDKLFKKTFVPEKCRITEKTNKPRKKYQGFKTVDEFIGI